MMRIRLGLLTLAFVVAISGLPGVGAEEPYIEPLALDNVTESKGVIQHREQLRSISDDGQRTLVMTVGGWQVFQRLEVAERGRATPYRLADHHPGVIYSGAAMSSDGRFVTYHAYDADTRLHGVYRWTIDTGAIEKIATVTRDFWTPSLAAISSDGRYVFYVEPVLQNRGLLYRHDMVTGTRTQMGFAQGEPDESSLVFSASGRYALYRVGAVVARRDFVNGQEKVIATLTPHQQGLGNALAISPEGRYVAYAGLWTDVVSGRVEHVDEEWPSTRGAGGRSVAGVSINRAGQVGFTTEASKVARDTNEVADVYLWSPDGSYRLLSISDLGTQLHLPSMGVLLSPDGAWVAFGTHGQSAHSVSRHQGEEFWNDAVFLRPLQGPEPVDAGVVAAALRTTGGYWTVNRAGRVVGHGDASVLAPALPDSHDYTTYRPLMDPGEEVTSMSATLTGDGYWLFTSRGRAVPFGDAEFFGDVSHLVLSGPVIHSAATPTDGGYYMVGADGGVFAFGDAVFRGSVPGVLGPVPLNQPIVAITVTETNLGYRMVAADGGVFNFGDAGYFGSVPQVLPGVRLNRPIVGMVASADGYLNVAADGGIFAFGDVEFHGSLGANPPPVDVSAVLVVDGAPPLIGSGYMMFDRNGQGYGFGAGVDLLAG